jgi:hypothetical protein
VLCNDLLLFQNLLLYLIQVHSSRALWGLLLSQRRAIGVAGLRTLQQARARARLLLISLQTVLCSCCISCRGSCETTIGALPVDDVSPVFLIFNDDLQLLLLLLLPMQIALRSMLLELLMHQCRGIERLLLVCC